MTLVEWTACIVGYPVRICLEPLGGLRSTSVKCVRDSPMNRLPGLMLHFRSVRRAEKWGVTKVLLMIHGNRRDRNMFQIFIPYSPCFDFDRNWMMFILSVIMLNIGWSWMHFDIPLRRNPKHLLRRIWFRQSVFWARASLSLPIALTDF